MKKLICAVLTLSMLSAPPALAVAQDNGVTTEIVNTAAILYSNGFNTDADIQFSYKKDVAAYKSADPEKGSVASISSDDGYVEYEFGKYTDKWDGSIDTQWYDSQKEMFEITTGEQLAGLASLVNSGTDFTGKTIMLMNHIDLQNKEWTPVGAEEEKAFKGTFDGGNNEIKNLKITRNNNYRNALFGWVNGNIYNLGTNSSTITIPSSDKTAVFASALVADMSGSIDSCYVKNTNIKIERNSSNENTFVLDFAAPLAAKIGDSTTVSNCYSIDFTCYASWGGIVGGLIGISFGTNNKVSYVKNCYSGGICEVATNEQKGVPTRFYSIGAKNQKNYTTVSKCLYMHGEENIKGTADVYRNVFAEMETTDAEFSSEEEIISVLGDKFESDYYGINENLPILKNHIIPATQEVSISYESLAEEGASYTLKLLNGKEVLWEKDMSEFSDGIWHKFDMAFKNGEFTLLDNSAEVYSGSFIIGDITGIRLDVNGEINLENIKIYRDMKEILLELAEEIENDFISALTSFPYVTESFVLPSGNEDVFVTWTSGNSEIISDDATNVVQYNCSMPVVMTGRVKLRTPYKKYENPEIVIKASLVVSPREGATEQEIFDDIVRYVLAENNITDEEGGIITHSLKELPTQIDDVEIEWSSSDEEILAPDGTLTNPRTGDAQSVTLTATLTLNDVPFVKTYEFSVLSVEEMIDKVADSITYETLTDEDRLNITHDLNLPTEGLYSSKISWSSSNPEILTSDGYILELTDDEYVTLTATIEISGETIQKEFDFVVKMWDIEKVKYDIQNIEIPTEAAQDFLLPKTGERYGSNIEWVSDNEAIVIDGSTAQVTRPENTEGDKIVTLTATVIKGQSSLPQSYEVRVLSLPEDSILISEELEKVLFEDISIESKDEIINNFHLVHDFPYSIQAEWHSSDDTIVTNEGVVIRPEMDTPDKAVVLTLSLTRNSVTLSKSFEFTVLAYGTAEERLDMAKNALVFSSISQEPIELVSKDLILPENGPYGTTLEWKSSSDAIKIERTEGGYIGIVTRPSFGTANESVVLTAIISYRGEKTEKTFDIFPAEMDGEVSLSYENFEKCNLEETYQGELYEDVSVVAENTQQISTIVPDPVNPQNKVLRFFKEKGSSFVSSSTPSALRGTIINGAGENSTMGGNFKVKYRMYIEKLTNIYLRTVVAFEGGLEEVDIRVQADGTLLQKYTKATKKVEFGKWNDVCICFNSYENTLDVYINDKPYLEDAPYSYNSGVTRISAVKIKTFASGEAVADDDVIVYFDDFDIVRSVDYSGDLAEATKKMELGILSKQNINEITSDIIFPDLSGYEVVLSGESSDKSIISDNGKVTRPQKDTEVEYTVKVSNKYGGERSRKFYMNVKKTGYVSDSPEGTENAAQAVVYDLENAMKGLEQKYNLNYIKNSIELPEKGANNSNIIWESSNPAVVTEKGIVYRTEKDEKVKLTAICSLDGATDRRSIILTVIAKENVSEGGSGSSGGGGGAGGGYFSTQSERNEIVSPIPSTQKEQSFSDASGHWAENYIDYLSKSGVVNGNGSGKFLPDDNITREEFLAMVIRAADLKSEENAKTEFSDVTEDKWYYSTVITAVENNIVYGITSDIFGAGQNITRQDLCTIVCRVIKQQDKYSELKKEELFSDDKEIASYAQDSVYYLRFLQLVGGKGNNVFDPQGYATRAETAKIIALLMQNILMAE